MYKMQLLDLYRSIVKSEERLADWNKELIPLFDSPGSVQREIQEHAKGKCVYLIGSPIGLTKIGRTNDIMQRLSAFNVDSPVELSPVHLHYCDKADQVEKKLHKKFSSKKRRGEWFQLSPEDISWIVEKYG